MIQQVQQFPSLMGYNLKDLVRVHLPDTAGNATASYKPTNDYMNVVLNLTYGFTSDATVANRQPGHFIQPIAGQYSAIFTRLALADAITASQFYNAYFNMFYGTVPYVRNTQSAAAFHAFGSLPLIPFDSNGVLSVLCSGGVATDSISSIYADVLIYEKK